MHDARLAETAPDFKKFKKLHIDNIQSTKISHRPALDEVAPLSHQSKLGLMLYIAGWNPWTCTDGSCHIYL